MGQKRTPGNARVIDLLKNRDGSSSRQSQYKRKRWAVRWVNKDSKLSQKSFARKVEAEAYAVKINTEFQQGTYVDARKTYTTVGEVHEQWKRTQVRLKESTRANRQNAWRIRVAPAWENKRIGDITRGDVLQWVADLQENGDGAESIENALGVLRMVLQYAIDDGRLRVNPCADVSAPRRDIRPHPYLTVAQVEALADEISYGGNFIRVLAYTGLRWGEMAGLTPRAVNLETRRLSIFQTVSKGEKGRVGMGTPKSHEIRSVPFPESLLGVFKEACDTKASDDLIFTAPEGGLLRGDSYRPRYLRPAIAALRDTKKHQDFPQITPHDLRHTAASLAVSAGANAKTVQRMLGHKSAALTLDTYADLFDSDLDEVASRIDDLIIRSKAVEKGA